MKGSRQRSKEDMISQLPDPLISHILSHLRTKEAVKTSVLSTRWRSLWVWVPVLDLSSRDFPNDFNSLVSFCDRFFDSSRVSRIHKFKIHIDDYKLNSSPLEPWIDSAIERKIQHLDVHRALDIKIPFKLYNCETLVSLKLYEVEVSLVLDDVEFVSLPCLIKSMHLKYISYWTDASFERLVSCCPVLEDLTLFEYSCCTVSVYRVISRSLKKLMIKIDEDEEFSRSKFVVDAPLLRFLSIKDNLAESFVINHMDSNAKLDISLHVGLHNIDEARSIRGFLSGIVKVRDMSICKGTFRLICEYVRLKPLPQFANMSRLCFSLDGFDLEVLPTFLESFPNLKSLTMDYKENFLLKRDYFRNYRISSSSLPECLFSSVEFVDIKTSIYEYAPGIKLVRCFLENSAILKKLTLRLDHYSAKEKLLVKNILEIPRRSVTCQVVVQDARSHDM